MEKLCFDPLRLLVKPVKSLRNAGRGIGHGFHRAVACDAGQILPVQSGKGINILRRVSFSRFGLKREHEIVADFRWRENDWRRPDPKAALNGKAGAARHGGQRLGDGAAQLKPATGAERRAAAGDDAAGDGEAGAALSERHP